VSGDRAGVPRRHGRPPEAGYFAGLWKPLGYRSAALELPGLSLKFDGMDDAWWVAFLARYAPYARDTTTDRGAFDLTLSATRDDKAGSQGWHIEPPRDGEVEYNPVFLEAAPDGAAGGGNYRIRVCTYSLAASFSSAGGRGPAVFASGAPLPIDPRERAVENIVRVAVAWLALSRGGLLIHAASIVRDGRAWLFFGQSGAGKSTLAASSRRGQVVSDDLTLLLPGPEGPEVVGAPFRGTYQGGEPVKGRFPIATAFRLHKAGPSEPPVVEPIPLGSAMADAIANLPFVVDQLPGRPELFEVVERVLTAIPMRALRFRKEDDSWWDAVDAAGLL